MVWVSTLTVVWMKGEYTDCGVGEYTDCGVDEG